jgi:hypothetical protein
MHLTKLLLTALASAIIAAAQSPITADSPFQVRYAANLTAGDSEINITNTGANGASLYGPGYGGATGNICVNVYALDPGEELVSCCSCLVTPDALVSISVINSLISNTATGVRPTSVVIKLLASLAGGDGTGTSCTNSAASPTPLATGLAAWGTTIHAGPTGTFFVTETAFTPATSSLGEVDGVAAVSSGQNANPDVPISGEIASLANRCRNIIGNSSGAGICASCNTGGLGAVHL